MKFEVERTEIKQFEDGMKYIAIFDKDNKDWYEELKKFDKDTLKVMYNKDTHLILSMSKDATMIAPTMAGDVVEEIEYQEVEIAPDNYFVNGKIVKLKECETIKDGKIVFNKDFKLEQIKKDLSELKVEYSESEFLFKGKYWQRNREKGDRDSLTSLILLLTITGRKETSEWKLIDKDTREHVYPTLTLDDFKLMAFHMQSQLSKAIKTESEIIARLKTLSDEELKNFNAKEEFEKLWN
nr:MAG TPA: tail fiber assembly protein [Caudoviricetes sp.]